MPRLVLVDSSLLGREMIRTLLAGIDWVYMVGECSQYDQAVRTIETGNCDAVVLGLDGDPGRALRLVAELHQKQPSLPIIVTSSQANLLVQAHRQGASALLDCPVLLDALLIALRGVGSNGKVHDTHVARTIAVLASRGGAGCTTLAVNLGCTLAAEPRNEVALVDLDLVTGSAEVALDLVPNCRLSDIPESLEQLDLTLLDRLLIKNKDGLSLLPRSGAPQQASLIHAEHVQRILNMLRITFSHVLLDLGRGWSATELEGMHAAETLLLVAIPELCSTRNTVVLMNALRQEGLEGKVRIVMNRVGAYFGSDSLTLSKIEEVIGQPVYWQIPNDYKVLTGAWNAGIPLIRYAPKSKAHQSIAALAKDLCVRQK
jgi:pilus assembly protein CpaE